MKRLIISTLSALTFASLAAPAFASEIAATNGKTTKMNEITPFNLVSGSYQGRFTDQGIPSFNVFLQAIRTDKIEAEDLVKSAISAGRLSADTINDTEYLNSVDLILDNSDRN